MYYKVDCSLENFPAWSGARETLNVLVEKGDCEAVEQYLEDAFPETPTDTEINDVLRFEQDMIAEFLGYSSWEEYENGGDDDEEEDEEGEGEDE